MSVQGQGAGLEGGQKARAWRGFLSGNDLVGLVGNGGLLGRTSEKMDGRENWRHVNRCRREVGRGAIVK